MKRLSSRKGAQYAIGISEKAIVAWRHKNWLRTIAARVNLLALPVAISVLVIIFASLTPVFLTVENFQELAKDGSVLAVLAFGQAMVVIARGFDLSIGGNMAVVSVAAATIAQQRGIAVTIAVGIMIGLLIGSLNGLLVAFLRMSPLIVTLAVLSALNSVTFIWTNGLPVYGMPDSFSWAGTSFLGPVPFTAAVAVAAFALVLFVMRLTPFGVHVYATGGNPSAARLSGLSPRRVLFSVFAINGALAGLAGIILSSRLNSGQPALGQQGIELQVLAAVFLAGVSLTGGRGNLSQVFFAVILLTVLTNGLTLVGVESYVQSIVSGIVLVAAISLQRLLLRKPVRAPVSVQQLRGNAHRIEAG
jgi:ribose/xylose/arabinose/galactoside ABC-type transport system permease subunit